MDGFYERLHAECGVRMPREQEQDWEFCAGDCRRTGDYLTFYRAHDAEMDKAQKLLLINMIVQGIENLMEEGADIEALWSEAQEILLRDAHGDTVGYWADLRSGDDTGNWWNIAPKMRGLAKRMDLL